jgi:hypothetical protein
MARRHQQRADASHASDGEALRQVDLSHLRLQDMTPAERAEMRRRYHDFVRHFGGGAAPGPAPAPKRPRRRRWQPGAKR